MDDNINVASWETLPLLLSVQEAGKVLRVSQAKVYSLVTEPGFPRVKVGKTYKVSRDGLREWVAGRLASISSN